jgi:uncharacterized protein YegP (UPF0339 family)
MKSEPYGKVQFWKSRKDDQWYWRAVAPNGRIVADCSEGYRTLASARKGLMSLMRILAQA